MGNRSSSSLANLDAAEARFTAQETAELRASFYRLCSVSSDGDLLAERDFRHYVLLAAVPDMPMKLASRVFQTLAVNGNAFLDQGEFFCGVCVLVKGTLEEQLEFVFHVFDLHENGRLTRDVVLRFDEMIRKTCLYKDEGHWSGKWAVGRKTTMSIRICWLDWTEFEIMR